MSTLLYRQDADQVRDRLTAWWNGEDIGRPALLLTAPRLQPFEEIRPTAEPAGWQTHYSTSDYGYRVYLAQVACVNTLCFAEALPSVSPDLAPNCLALYLGGKGVEGNETVWVEPIIEEPETASFDFDPDNFYWDFTMRLAKDQLRLGVGKFLTSFPDLIEGLDTLAALRGTQELLYDLMDRPEWVTACLDDITERYFDYYDRLYDLIADERGGSIFWAWAPGRMSKLQCDFSAMLSPEMFDEYMVPVLRRMTARLDYCMYHWDGPGAIPHHDLLLGIDDLPMIQWTPGAAAEPVTHERWWPLYHKTIDAGKKIFLHVEHDEDLVTFKAEFGSKIKQFMLRLHARSEQRAAEILSLMEES